MMENKNDSALDECPSEIAIAVTQVVPAIETQDGDGARVKRSIGTGKLSNVDPFLMLDEFFVTPPAGFPDHPLRGFDTVTYMLDGAFTHKDNQGHEGTINAGDLQWMTAGRGIIHSEMPGTEGVNHGLQLWVNLAAEHKMTEPQYQELLSKDVPEVTKDGVTVRIIAGESCGVKASVYTRTPTMYLDVKMAKGTDFVQQIPSSYRGFVYVIKGSGTFGGTKATAAHTLVLSQGTQLSVHADEEVHYVILGGKPIGEPVARYGPFVMNTKEEIRQAIVDYQTGRFQ